MRHFLERDLGRADRLTSAAIGEKPETDMCADRVTLAPGGVRGRLDEDAADH
jgi:hypothetical protein